MSFLFQMASFIATYVVILLQFQLSEKTGEQEGGGKNSTCEMLG